MIDRVAEWQHTLDVSGLVLFLCSDAAAYLTGQAINIDGGKIML
jgi:NAD(P)-dependent dehydrogenase (short-subunit alcohol dehydrogenase family)